MYRNHVAPRTKLSVPKDDFPGYESLSAHTTRATQQTSARRIYVGSKQTHEETYYNKTWEHVARSMVKHVKKPSFHGQRKIMSTSTLNHTGFKLAAVH